MSSTRIKASLIHLLLSVCVFVVAFGFVYTVWFPYALFEVSGGLDGLKIVAYVDLLLGPLLMLVIFNPLKTRQHLLKDIAIIVGLQLMCLVAGLWAVYCARPLAVVHVYDTFYVINRADMEAANLKVEGLERFPVDSPKILYVATEKNLPAFRTKQVLDRLNGRPELQWRVHDYKPWDLEQVLLLDDKNGDDGCLLRNIQSVYRAGTICFDSVAMKFDKFQASQSISLLGVEPR